MADQPPPMPRPLFRLLTIAHPASEVQPQPSASQPRPLLVRPAPFKPPTAQPQPTPPPPAAVSPQPLPPTVTSSSVPTSPAPKAMPSSSMLPVTSSSSVPSSPKPKISASSTSLQPTSPAPKSVPSSSVPTSPTPKAAATATTMTHELTPTSSPKIDKPSAETPPESPKIKPPPASAPSLILPPSQFKSNAESGPKIPLEVEEKHVLMQKTIDNYNRKCEATKNVETKEKGIHKKFSGTKVGMTVITIAGENKGAFMELGHSHNEHDIEGNTHQMNNSRAKNNGNDEGKLKMTDKSHQKLAMASSSMSTFINSNVQSVNNSILHNCSCTYHDPGVHLALSRNPTGGRGINLKDHTNGHHI